MFGIAASWVDERSAAAKGQLSTTPIHFQDCDSLPYGGVLLLLPFLIETGLLSFKNHYDELDPGYYYIDAIVILLAIMYLCRIKNPEQLKKINPGEFGKLLGLDRIPEAKCLRNKIKAIVDQKKASLWNMELANTWSKQEENEFYYIDGHVQVYHGHQATLGKKHVSRERLCLPGTQEFWVNNSTGMPYFYVCGEVNEKLQEIIGDQIVPKLLKEMNLSPSTDKDQPVLTIVFDREAYSPKFFKKLWDDYRIAIISYRKNVKEKWEEDVFSQIELSVDGVETTMKLAEQEVILDQFPFREIRKLNSSSHQTSVLTTHPSLTIQLVAAYMFSRWTQENFFKYMIQDYDFDKISEYTVDQIDSEFEVVNPAYNKVDYKLKKVREKIARKQAKLYSLSDQMNKTDLEETPKELHKRENLENELATFQTQEEKLIETRKETSYKIKIKDMGQEKYNKLNHESKLFRNIIKMICYRAETSFVSMLTEGYKKKVNEKRAIGKSVIQTMADIKVDQQEQILQVSLYTQSTPRDNAIVENICQKLNQKICKFPGTNLVLRYKTATA